MDARAEVSKAIPSRASKPGPEGLLRDHGCGGEDLPLRRGRAHAAGDGPSRRSPREYAGDTLGPKIGLYNHDDAVGDIRAHEEIDAAIRAPSPRCWRSGLLVRLDVTGPNVDVRAVLAVSDERDSAGIVRA